MENGKYYDYAIVISGDASRMEAFEKEARKKGLRILEDFGEDEVDGQEVRFFDDYGEFPKKEMDELLKLAEAHGLSYAMKVHDAQFDRGPDELVEIVHGDPVWKPQVVCLVATPWRREELVETIHSIVDDLEG